MTHYHVIQNIKLCTVDGKIIDYKRLWEHRLDICVIGALIALSVYCLCSMSREEIQQFIGGNPDTSINSY